MTLKKSTHHLLVVDDEPGMRDMLTTELEGQGYQVVTAGNGQEALERMRTQKFDLVITDLMMPQMNGMSLLENIKSLKSELEVIIATGHGTVESAVAAMKNGAYDFILKPFNLDELNALIERALEKKSLKTLVGLYEASNAIFSTIQLNTLFEIVMDLLQKVLGADQISIMLLNEQNKLTIAASRGLSEEIAREAQLEIGERVAGIVAAERRPRLLINGLEKYPEFAGVSTNHRIKSSILCPLLAQGELLGVLNISRTENLCDFRASDLQSAAVFASQVALAIQNAKLYDNLQKAYRKIENTQADLIQSEKMASIGRLTAGVAHELNNPLTAVIGYSQLISESQDLHEIHRQIPIIVSQAQRCSAIVKDLLLFSRRQKPSCEAINPALLMEEIIKGMSLELEKRKITLSRDLANMPLVIKGDPHLLKQVFINLLTNAYQALEEVDRERRIEIKVGGLGEKVRFSFKDNGPGIPKEIIRKIFDPFYTTKEVGKGTGLGLSLTYGIIKEHGGSISVESEVGKGTNFIIEMPLKPAEEPAKVPADRPQVSHFNLPPETRILLAEDEAPIRGLVEKIFSEENCKIDIAEDGQAALEMLKKQNYDLILSDYRMPKINGVELYKQAVEINPLFMNRFLFISGSTEFMRGIDSHFEGNHLPVLLKPFTRDDLASAVNSVIKNGYEGKKGNRSGTSQAMTGSSEG